MLDALTYLFVLVRHLVVEAVIEALVHLIVELVVSVLKWWRFR